MASTMALFSHICSSPITKTKGLDVNPRNCFRVNVPLKPQSAHCIKTISLLSTLNSDATIKSNGVFHSRIVSKASASVSGLSSDSVEEPETKVKFQTSLSLPGCSSALSLLGTGYREKVFAVIGVKVYAAGLYANPSIFSELDEYRGSSADKIRNDSSIFDAMFQSPLEKSLKIVLVRDADGKTFWDALDEAISPRIKSSTATDELALSKFREIFQGRPLKKGTNIYLNWLEKTKILICVSSDGKPTSVDATIESLNVVSALFDIFLGKNPVSPSLKLSVSKGLVSALSY